MVKVKGRPVKIGPSFPMKIKSVKNGPNLPVWVKIRRRRFGGRVVYRNNKPIYKQVWNQELYEVNYWYKHLRANPGMFFSGTALP